MRFEPRTMQRAVLVCLAIGFALLAGSELWFAAQSMSAVSAGQPQTRADPPRALSIVLSLSAFFLPLGLVGTGGLLATRLWPEQERRRALVAVACFGVAVAFMLAPAIMPGTRATATFSLVAAALGIVILAWNQTRSRALLLVGAALLALRFPAFAFADAAYVRASGDGSWSAASWWSVAAFATGAAASLCLALALAWRVKEAPRVLTPTPRETVA